MPNIIERGFLRAGILLLVLAWSPWAFAGDADANAPLLDESWMTTTVPGGELWISLVSDCQLRSWGSGDRDLDGVYDRCDFCPDDASNDVDFDKICGASDNCPAIPNQGQDDQDADGQGDLCDICPLDASNDADGDGLCGDVDNCDGATNAGQADSDGDGYGDACDVCPNDATNDADGDGVCGEIDNCPSAANSGQADSDSDGYGDACDADDDDDGVDDLVDVCPLTVDPGQADNDSDGVGDACDSDDDGDGVVDGDDSCLHTSPGAAVDASGCSIAELAPCTTEWKNHGAYVRAVAHVANRFVAEGILTVEAKDAIVAQAGASACGG